VRQTQSRVAASVQQQADRLAFRTIGASLPFMQLSEFANKICEHVAHNAYSGKSNSMALNIATQQQLPNAGCRWGHRHDCCRPSWQ
jgi:hypothetical protein